MEQHNIDSRFKKGLENLNRQPSADAWARLQSQLNAPEVAPEPVTFEPEKKEEKRILMWWHYAAAAVIFLFLGVGLLKNGINSGEKTAPELAVNKSTSQPKAAEEIIVNPNPVSVPEAIETAPATALASAASPKLKKENVNENGSKLPVKANQPEASTPQLAQVSSPVKKEKTGTVPAPTIQEEKPANLQPQTLLAQNEAKPVKPETKDLKAAGFGGMAIEIVVKRDHTSNALAVNNAPAHLTEQEENDSKIKSIFKQARNIKNGEKVNLQALGVDTDSKLALGTRTLHEKFTKVLDI